MKSKTKTIALILGFLVLAGCSATAIEKGTVTITPGADKNMGSVSDIISTEPGNAPATTSSPDTMEFSIELEGMQEKMTLTKYKGASFFIYYDAGNFTIEDSSGDDVGFYLNNPDPNIYPDISLIISFEQAATAQEKAEALLSDTDLEYRLISEEKIGGLPAKQYHAIADTNPQWDSITSDIYFIDGNGGCFTIACSGYLEASEGWGARIGAMVGTFSLED